MKTVIAVIFVITTAVYLLYLTYFLYKKAKEQKNDNKSKMNDVILQLEKQQNMQNDMILKSLCKLLGLDINSLTEKQKKEIQDLFGYTYTRLKSRNVIIKELSKILTVKYKDVITNKQQAESVITFCFMRIKNSNFFIKNDEDLKLIISLSNSISEEPEHESSEEKQLKYVEDPEYGLTVKKPIYTKSIAKSKEFLNSLRTLSGKRLSWSRGTTYFFSKQSETVDSYIGTLKGSGKSVCIYINPYGTINPPKAPNGFYIKTNNIETQNQSHNILKINKSVSKKALSKKVLISLGLIVILLLVALFANYQKMPGKAKGELATYLAKNLPYYTSMQNIYYTVDFNSKGYKVTLGGNVKSNKKSTATLYSEVQFNHLMINPEIKTIKINNKKFTKENIERYVSNYWWN